MKFGWLKWSGEMKRWSGRHCFFKLLILALMLGLSMAAAFDPKEGTELVLTDSSGETLLGYGFVEGRQLTIDISELPADFLILVLNPDGSFETLTASNQEGNIELELASGERALLDAWLANQNVAYHVNHIRSDDLNENDDSRGKKEDQKPSEDSSHNDDKRDDSDKPEDRVDNNDSGSNDSEDSDSDKKDDRPEDRGDEDRSGSDQGQDDGEDREDRGDDKGDDRGDDKGDDRGDDKGDDKGDDRGGEKGDEHSDRVEKR